MDNSDFGGQTRTPSRDLSIVRNFVLIDTHVRIVHPLKHSFGMSFYAAYPTVRAVLRFARVGSAGWIRYYNVLRAPTETSSPYFEAIGTLLFPPAHPSTCNPFIDRSNTDAPRCASTFAYE